MISRFRVWENQSNNLLEVDDKDEAIKFAQDRHRTHMDRWHEIYRFDDGNMAGHGMAQWKPTDCPTCHVPCEVITNTAGETVYYCERCDTEIPYRQKCHFRIMGYCDECTVEVTDKMAFKTKKEECDSVHASNLRTRVFLERQRNQVGPI